MSYKNPYSSVTQQKLYQYYYYNVKVKGVCVNDSDVILDKPSPHKNPRKIGDKKKLENIKKAEKELISYERLNSLLYSPLKSSKSHILIYDPSLLFSHQATYRLFNKDRLCYIKMIGSYKGDYYRIVNNKIHHKLYLSDLIKCNTPLLKYRNLRGILLDEFI